MKVGDIYIAKTPGSWMPAETAFKITGFNHDGGGGVQMLGLTTGAKWLRVIHSFSSLIALNDLTKLEIALLNINL